MELSLILPVVLLGALLAAKSCCEEHDGRIGPGEAAVEYRGLDPEVPAAIRGALGWPDGRQNGMMKDPNPFTTRRTPR